MTNHLFFFIHLFKKRLIFLAVFLCLPHFAFSQENLTRHGGQVVFTITSDPKSFNPIIAKETSTTVITNYLFEGLTRTNAETLEVEPNLAKRWHVSSDGLTWDFYLRQDVVWSDGEPFSADDVIFTFNDLIYNPDIPTSARDIFTIEGKEFNVIKIDDHTVRFQLPMRFAPFLRSMGSSIMPKHKLKESVDNKTFNFTWGIDTPVQDIVATGAYLIDLYQPGQRIILKANPHYWRRSQEGERLPFISRIVYLIVQNPDVAVLKFLEGQVDAIAVRGTDFPLLKPLEERQNFTIHNLGPNFGSNFLVFNQNTRKHPQSQQPFVDPVKLPWFRNRDFRRAVAHAIDKKRIIEIVMNGLGYPQDSPVVPIVEIFYNPDVKRYPYDLEKARKILHDAGFHDHNGDGVLQDPKGNNVEFNLLTNSGSAERVQTASMIRHDLEQLGMKVNFLALEFNNLVSKLVASYDWDAMILGLTGGIEPHFGKNVWVSDGQLHFWNPGQSTPGTDWERRVDEIFNQAVQILDDEKRKPLYDEWQMIISEELPLIYTVLSANLIAVRNKFKNIRPTAYGGVFHNLEEIYIKKEFR